MPAAPHPAPTVDGAPADGRTLRHVWNECVGAGRANEALRADWQQHFREAVDVLGARYVRFHGLFHDDMFVYRGNDGGGGGFAPPTPLATPVHTFSYVDKVFDFILSTGARPFVELGFMPRDLATQTETLFWWKAHCSPPNDMGRWADLVTATVEHWIERYGLDEVRQWRFEVWNEPNLYPLFWTGTRTQYFELYEATVRAIKAVDAGLLVGGPSTSVFVPDARYAGEVPDREASVATAEAEDVDALDWRPVWIEEFIAWCAERDLPVDFLSAHLYPTDYAAASDGSARAITRYVDATYDDLTLLRRIIAASPYPDAEVHLTEWSSSPSSRDRTHDTLFAATWITRAYLRCAHLADSISYWTFTDVFEEGGAGLGPFHGGFGLVNEQGLHKPTFHAFAMLAQLGDEVLAELPHGVLTRDRTTGRVAGVLFHYPDEMGGASVEQQHSYERARAYGDVGTPRAVRHTIAGLPAGATFDLVQLDLDHGDVAEAWHHMGEPVNLTRPQEAELRAVADDLLRDVLVASDEGVLEIDLVLPPWAVVGIVQTSPATED
ncbi:Xylan 1,4-beta-xylosidase [Cellulomonas flavigena DSM 20109]|uniref:Xylan 1,4-beta-xylosidase n=1 Tax=Cellulomonas flavigena (strain ATCC 482 / DSM 20109 / BCRC 11376 / JCM 18109 / NBRC 3775 / NCIMB 8073 / NRS 134) TaxID=446466 RepID=D5UJY8_CELFN|nr:glycoside hydrolase family 39 [Cellulomonas flavigena]ADG73730.1 Xylan 1,4-beta-xylosidase [Cellulomonas flavigena DSM 20109]